MSTGRSPPRGGCDTDEQGRGEFIPRGQRRRNGDAVGTGGRPLYFTQMPFVHVNVDGQSEAIVQRDVQ